MRWLQGILMLLFIAVLSDAVITSNAAAQKRSKLKVISTKSDTLKKIYPDGWIAYPNGDTVWYKGALPSCPQPPPVDYTELTKDLISKDTTDHDIRFLKYGLLMQSQNSSMNPGFSLFTAKLFLARPERVIRSLTEERLRGGTLWKVYADNVVDAFKPTLNVSSNDLFVHEENSKDSLGKALLNSEREKNKLVQSDSIQMSFKDFANQLKHLEYTKEEQETLTGILSAIEARLTILAVPTH